MSRNPKVKRLWVDQGATKVGISYDIRRQAIVLAEFMAFVEDQFDEILARPTISGASPGSLLCYSSNLWTLAIQPYCYYYKTISTIIVPLLFALQDKLEFLLLLLFLPLQLLPLLP